MGAIEFGFHGSVCRALGVWVFRLYRVWVFQVFSVRGRDRREDIGLAEV